MASKKSTAIKIDRQWEIDSAMRTLQEAERIKKDKFLMNGVKTSLTNLNKMVSGGPVKSISKSKKK